MATATANESTDPSVNVTQGVQDVLKFLGSLKWTIALFALSMVVIMAGTMAQDEMNMQQVKDAYFTCWFSRVYIDDFVPQSFYAHDHRIGANALMPNGFWFPFLGGKLIGFGLLINLITAKMTRFHIRARGPRLVAGIGIFCVGLAILLAIVISGSAAEGLQGQPPSYPMVWNGLCSIVALSLAGSIYGIFAAGRKGWKYVFGLLSSVLAIGSIAILMGFTIGEPGLRVVWQLAKGLGIGAFMLVGCLLLFGQQGGNLLLHFGVALLMIGQFAFGDRQLEQRLVLKQRESSNTLINMDKIELAFMDQSQEGATRVIGVPATMLARYEGSDKRITDPRLPFEIQVLSYMENSGVGQPSDSQADTGLGQEFAVKETATIGGASEGTNVPSAYIRLYEPGQEKPLGTYLVTQYLNDAEKLFTGGAFKDTFDTVQAGDTAYRIGLRYARVAKPYWVQLSEVRRTNYSGTETPRDYSSFIRIVNPETGEDRKERIWMNNPLRYGGETFYQSQYLELPSGKATVLQVVQNQGWLVPYIACGIVTLGMLVHFIGTLDRFLARRERETKKMDRLSPPVQSDTVWPVLVTFGIVCLFVASMLIPSSTWKSFSSAGAEQRELDLYRAGEIPVMWGGRAMPLDQFARQSLQVVSNKQSLPGDAASGGLADRIGEKLSAMEWFFETISSDDSILSFPMIRIDAQEVLSEIGIAARPQHRYSFNELRDSFEKIETIAKAARDKEPRERSFKENAVATLHSRLNHFLMIQQVFQRPLRVDDLRQDEIPEGLSLRELREAVLRVNTMRIMALQRIGGPAIIPPSSTASEIEGEEPEWRMFAPAALEAYATELDGKEANIPGLKGFKQMMAAYVDQDAERFNAGAEQAIATVAAANPPHLVPWRIKLERWLVGTHTSLAAFILYVIALLMSLACLLFNLPRLRQTVTMLIGTTIILHTVIIVSRMLITNRAPVINLYSSAVFISWAGVAFGLGLQKIYRHGMGGMVASLCGVLGLLVAYGLNSGDTMPVLQAVLDTQFWLSTHVVTITLGYSATFLAGIMGILYLLSSPKIHSKLGSYRRDLYRMIYGACCFGILFSFVGTVLGGLWADDSWGRFWGWDPKENGALLIVIWNALMLHARWDGMVGERGFATLAIGGNIVTAWSWFGTNQLGFGLHSYGGQDSVKRLLVYFLISQVVMLAIGVVGSQMKSRDVAAD